MSSLNKLAKKNTKPCQIRFDRVLCFVGVMLITSGPQEPLLERATDRVLTEPFREPFQRAQLRSLQSY